MSNYSHTGLNHYLIPSVSDSDNSPVSDGSHVQDFTATLGMTHYLGVSVDNGHVWQATGKVLQRDF